MEVIEYNDRKYPQHVQSGNAQRFIAPMALEFCKGHGLDIGGKDKWLLPGATAVNVEMDDGFHAMSLPAGDWDFIFSSHTLEHLDNPLDALLYWKSRLRVGGVVFLYLPHGNMEMWRPENMWEHKHIFYPEDMKVLLGSAGYGNVFVGHRDLNWSFAAVAEKVD